MIIIVIKSLQFCFKYILMAVLYNKIQSPFFTGYSKSAWHLSFDLINL